MMLDITDKEAIYKSVEKSIAMFGQVDGIINNAGIIQPFKKLIDTDFSIMTKVVEINFGGTMYMIKAFLPHLLTRPEAHIVNISSMGGFLPVPGQAIYGASKAAVKMMSECLNSELLETNVRVTIVSPGAIFTNIKSNSGLGKEDGVNANEYESAPRGVLLPSVAAELIAKGVERNKVRIYIGKDSKFMNFLYHISPDFACNLIYKKIKENHNL
jgi:short-subunit dehydrogenase